MLKFTREKFNQFKQRIAELNHISDVGEQFNVDPTVQQTIEQEMQHSSEFLQQISLVPVVAQTGQKVSVGVSGPIAGRTDTSGGVRRQPRDMTSTRGKPYLCVQTDYDTAFPYATLDSWAHKPNFQIALRDAIIKRQALDRILVGWNGVSVATTTNRDTNPLLQDVNKGWFQNLKEEAPSQLMSGIEIGGADYKTLDGLVFDMRSSLLEPWYRKDPGLVVIVGEQLLTQTLLPFIDAQESATNKQALDSILESQCIRFGGLKPMTVPYFPDRGIWVGTLANLAIYYQVDARRRYFKDEPQYNRIANYESSNDAYVIEDTGCAAAVLNVKLPGDDEAGAGGGSESEGG